MDDPETAAETQEGSMSATDQVHARMATAREAEAKRQAKLNADLAEAREARYEEFVNSEAGQVRANIDEAERIMRLPTPDALKETGAVVGDATKGPSS
jgi:hypothetical protein